MDDEHAIFRPARQPGLALQSGAAMLLAGLAGIGLLWAFDTAVGAGFLLLLAPSLLAAGLTPLVAYRAFALYTASYEVERDGILLRWGLRVEHIPMKDVLWVRPANELGTRLPLPALRWPGSVLGVRNLPDGERIEYLASTIENLQVIGAPGRGFVISPEDAPGFRRAYNRLRELGSLAPIPPRSIYPIVLLRQVWDDRWARFLLLEAALLSAALLAWTALAAPGRSLISLGFLPDGSLQNPVPAVRLLLLPVLNLIFVLADFLGGLYFFRQPKRRRLAYLLWAAGTVASLLFLAAVYFILAAV
jgi:hypothetical protein